MQTLRIDVVSDVACPWCVIGYKNLAQAMETLKEDLDFSLQWHAFELRPDAPEEGENWREHLMKKYGLTWEQSEENRQRITEAGRQLGFTFNFTDDMRTQNTFNCHRLLAWAAQTEQQTALKLALFKAYFTDRANVNDPDILASAASEAGLDPVAAREILEGTEFSQQVREEEARYQRLGVQSVPTFIVNGKYAITGGQPAEVFQQALQDIAREMAETDA